MIKSILHAKLNNEQKITELFFSDIRVGWVQRTENGGYIAQSYISGKIYRGEKIMAVLQPIEREVNCK